MKKTKFATHPSFVAVVPNHVESIALMETTELYNKLHQFEKDRVKLKGYDQQKDLEVEICYLQREIQIRQDQNYSHNQYVQNFLANEDIEKRKYLELEDTYPEPDMDNSAYTDLWNYWN